MGASLPTELADLQAKFNAICDQVDAQEISYDEALATLKNLSVFDGNSVRWSVNEEGMFVTGHPDETLTPADPTQFVSRDNRTGFGAPMSSAPVSTSFGAAFVEAPPPGVMNTTLTHTGPVFPQTTSTFSSYTDSGAPTGFQPRGRANGSDFETDPVFAGPPETAPKTGWRGVKRPRAVKPAKVKAPTVGTPGVPLLTQVFDAVRSVNYRRLTQGRARTALIIAGCVVLLCAVAHLMGRSTGGDTGSIPHTSATTGAPSMPTNGKSRSVLTGDDLHTLLSAVSSNSRDVAKDAVANPGDDIRVALAVGQLYGYTKTGLQLSAGTPAADGDNAIVDVRLVNQADQKTYATAKVTLVRKNGQWLLTDWPNFTRQ
jgi:hypothetical protein